MPTLFDGARRESLQERLGALDPGAAARWGKMTAPQMLCHVADQMRVALGDVPAVAVPTLLRFKPVRWLFVDRLPWPKGRIPTAPEMQRTRPGEWADDLAATRGLIDRFATASPTREWPVHPAFGRLSGDEWGSLSARHLDYHLQQFGA
jgi:hypothetical protein